MNNALTVGDIANLQAPTLRVDTSLPAAIDILLGHKINGAPVCDTNGSLIGFLSAHDIMVEFWCKDHQLDNSVKVGDLMKTNVAVIEASERLSDALEYLALDMKQLYPTTDMGYATEMTTLSVEERAKSMKVSKPQILPVLDKGQYVGVISRHEVLNAIRLLFDGSANLSIADIVTANTA
ncbi:CBS domain-containing protein [Thaumasiovibrio sp. DFM-14]|uniref:CBS domain-containing protein n=1 Tax=Thaumasiovibrio sp. DFM-14 TaxID=3384792 RepID=UPI0039A2A721